MCLGFFGNYHDSPWKSFCGSPFVNIWFTALYQSLQHIVSALLDVLGYGRIHSVKGCASVRIVQIHPGVIEKVRFREAELYPVRPVHGERQECKPFFVPHIGNPHLPILGKTEFGGLGSYRYGFMGDKAISRTIIVDSEDYAEVFGN